VFSRLVIPDLLLAELIEHARRGVPIECCGLLAGQITNGVGFATTRYPIENELASPTDYLTDARGMFLAFRSMRERGIELLAIYHSHPASEPVPSRRDIERNTYGETVVHLIVSLAGTEPEVRGWWLTEAGYREAELIVPTP
jgi:[CysO sulfur-carrier protein]-S-L-cysteine hydrolase